MVDSWRDSRDDEEHWKFDLIAHAATEIDHVHRMNHDGFVFHSSGKVAGMVDSNVDDFLLVTPASPEPHIQTFELRMGRGDIDILTYEGTTTSADGAAQSVLNTHRDRAATQTPGTTLHIGPTVSAVGTLIHTQWLPPTATGTGLSGGGFVGEGAGEEWILKPSTKYLIRITNNSGATIDYRWEAVWYEPGYDV